MSLPRVVLASNHVAGDGTVCGGAGGEEAEVEE